MVKNSLAQPCQVDQLARPQGTERRSGKHCDFLDRRAAVVTLTNGMVCVKRFVDQEAGPSHRL